MPKTLFSRVVVIILGAGLLAVVLSCCGPWRSGSSGSSALDAQVSAIGRELTAIEAREREANRTVWAAELVGQRCGQVFETLWDAVNRASNKLEVLEAFPIERILCPAFAAPQTLAHGIRVFRPEGGARALAPDAWRALLAERRRAGWRLEQLEFRHIQFDPDTAGRPHRSRFYFAAHLTQDDRLERAVLHGDLVVDWRPGRRPTDAPTVRQIDAGALTLKTRQGPLPFEPVMVETLVPPRGSLFIDPVLAYDLDGDGKPAIVMAAKNLVFRQRADGRFDSVPFLRHDPGLIFTGLIADFDGDGVADFLCAKFEGLFLYRGSPGGAFEEPPQLAWAATPHLRYAQFLTCGDVDSDGAPDVWLGQYKLPYVRGQMPTPYYDANDGDLSYLLHNDGHGHFTDVTAAAGLEAKRRRRSYSGSLIDLDGDGHLDLVVASDFAGLDLFANDGHGHFTDVTQAWAGERHALGMSQVCADFDRDGTLDLLMVGMNVPVMDRLRHLGCARPGFDRSLEMGAALAHGNRLFQGQASSGWRQSPLGDSIARTGWSWGAGVLDFDNDGFPDVYIANGHESKASVRDYETEFWLHDIYVGNSRDSVAADVYFQKKYARTRGQGMSYGGYEKNRFLLNQRGETFLEAGHLFGIALEQDCRNVVAEDFDGDGRVDLLVTTFEAWPEVRQTVRVFRNTLETAGNWIGFRLREQGRGVSPVAARVTIRYDGVATQRHLTAGDSYRSQRPNTVHFGIGASDRVDRAEIRWVNGQSVTLDALEINRYHAVNAPAVSGVSPDTSKEDPTRRDAESWSLDIPWRPPAAVASRYGPTTLPTVPVAHSQRSGDGSSPPHLASSDGKSGREPASFGDEPSPLRNREPTAASVVPGCRPTPGPTRELPRGSTVERQALAPPSTRPEPCPPNVQTPGLGGTPSRCDRDGRAPQTFRGPRRRTG